MWEIHVRTSNRTSTVLIEDFRGLSQPLQAIARMDVISYWAGSAFLSILTNASYSYYFSTLGYTARAADSVLQ